MAEEEVEVAENVEETSEETSEGGDYLFASDVDCEDADIRGSNRECFLAESKKIDAYEDITKISFTMLTSEVIKELDFLNYDLAFDFYNEYGKSRGFSVRRHKVGYSKKGHMLWKSFVCSRNGKKCMNYVNDGSKRVEKKDTRCGCLAELRVHVESTTGRWFVCRFLDEHNHPTSSRFGGMMRSHRRMTDADVDVINSMRKAGIGTTEIYRSFASQLGGYKNIQFSRKDMYNRIFREKRRAEGDANAALSYLRERGANDAGMFWRHAVDGEGHLRHLFWCDGISRLDYELFGDVLAFDATYGRNKYRCPVVVFSGVNHHMQTIIFGTAIVSDETEETYVWMLGQLLCAMNGKCPKSVITDGDMAMRNAIIRVFPEAHHRLCAWHLLRNATRNVCKPQFTKSFQKCMMWDYEVDEFEKKWEAMVVENNVQHIGWVKEIYEKRRMWASAHMKGLFFAGLRTTSRCEALHSQMGRYVGSRDNLCEFLEHMGMCLEFLRFNELQAEFKSNHGVPAMHSSHRALEMSAASIYTEDVFYVFRDVLMKTGTVHIIGQKRTASKVIFMIEKYYTERRRWHVSYFPNGDILKCSCKRLETYGLPCVHIIIVLLKLNIKELPSSIVLDRWRKTAKEGLEGMAARGDIVGDHGRWIRSAALAYLSQELYYLASASNDTFNEYKEKILYDKKVLKSRFAEMNVGDLVSGEGGSYDANIRDPVGVRSKGNCSQQRQRMQRCSQCRSEGHNRRSCPGVQDGKNFEDEIVESLADVEERLEDGVEDDEVDCQRLSDEHYEGEDDELFED